jgi:hypothetical protein
VVVDLNDELVNGQPYAPIFDKNEDNDVNRCLFLFISKNAPFFDTIVV